MVTKSRARNSRSQSRCRKTKTKSRCTTARSSCKRKSQPKKLRFFDLQQGKSICLPVKRYKIAENGRKYAEAEANGRKYTLFVKK